LWEGNFQWCRCGYPNIYTEAYNQYVLDGGDMDLEDFKEEVHKAVYDENRNYVGMSETSQKYGKLVYSDTSIIDLLDPSGGPYLCSGFSMDHISEEFEGMVIERFERVEEGYKILIKK
jgi:hypothetical protein